MIEVIIKNMPANRRRYEGQYVAILERWLKKAGMKGKVTLSVVRGVPTDSGQHQGLAAATVTVDRTTRFVLIKVQVKGNSSFVELRLGVPKGMEAGVFKDKLDRARDALVKADTQPVVPITPTAPAPKPEPKKAEAPAPQPTEEDSHEVGFWFSKDKSELTPDQREKLVELQATITLAEFTQLQLFMENGWLTQSNGWFKPRLDRDHIAFGPDEEDELIVFLDKLEDLGLASHTGFSKTGVDVVHKQCINLSGDVFLLIPHLVPPPAEEKPAPKPATPPAPVPEIKTPRKQGPALLAKDRNPAWIWLNQIENFSEFLLALASLVENPPRGGLAPDRSLSLSSVIPHMVGALGLGEINPPRSKNFSVALRRLIDEREEFFLVDTEGVDRRFQRMGLTEAGWAKVHELREPKAEPTPEPAPAPTPEPTPESEPAPAPVQAVSNIRQEVEDRLKALPDELTRCEGAIMANLAEQDRLSLEHAELRAQLDALHEERAGLMSKLAELEAEEQAKQARERAIQAELGRLGELPKDVLAELLEKLAAQLRSDH